jgi:Ca2+-binding EF-hand superfamily protein
MEKTYAAAIAARTVLAAVLLYTGSVCAKDEPHDIRVELAAADANGDGMVSRREFLDRRSARFDKLDVDDDGVLSKDEFGVALEGTPMQRFQSMAFKRADSDNDSGISKEEWDNMPARGFDRMDRNGDGNVDGDELAP